MSGWHGRVDEALARAATKREAAEALGVPVAALHGHLYSARPDTYRRVWRALPSGGAYAGRDRGLPGPSRRQAEADALVAEAASDVGHLSPCAPSRHTIVRLLLGIYAITGSLDLPRGWVRAVLRTLAEADCPPTTPSVVRWYRTVLASDPGRFADVPGVDPVLLDDISRG